MNKFEKLEDLSKIKKEINKEGFEENAAVLIGKKEEMPELKEKLANKGVEQGVAEFIRNHKEIIVPQEEIKLEEKLKKQLTPGLGFLSGHQEEILTYIDKNENIARAELDLNKISELLSLAKKIYAGEPQEAVKKALPTLGFQITNYQELIESIEKEIERYQDEIKKRQEKEKFDF